jgi:hypothetical protein
VAVTFPVGAVVIVMVHPPGACSSRRRAEPTGDEPRGRCNVSSATREAGGSSSFGRSTLVSPLRSLLHRCWRRSDGPTCGWRWLAGTGSVVVETAVVRRGGFPVCTTRASAAGWRTILDEAARLTASSGLPGSPTGPTILSGWNEPRAPSFRSRHRGVRPAGSRGECLCSANRAPRSRLRWLSAGAGEGGSCGRGGVPVAGRC